MVRMMTMLVVVGLPVVAASVVAGAAVVEVVGKALDCSIFVRPNALIVDWFHEVYANRNHHKRKALDPPTLRVVHHPTRALYNS